MQTLKEKLIRLRGSNMGKKKKPIQTKKKAPVVKVNNDHRKFGIARARILMPIIIDVSTFAPEDGMDFVDAKKICVEYYRQLADNIESMSVDNFDFVIENNLSTMGSIVKE